MMPMIVTCFCQDTEMMIRLVDHALSAYVSNFFSALVAYALR